MEKTFSFATLMHNHYFQDPEPHPKEVENEEAVSDSLHHTDMELIAESVCTSITGSQG